MLSETKKFDCVYTPVRELYELGYISDVSAQVLHCDIELKNLDYVSMLGDLKDSKIK